jgi:hypothetical protein
VASICWRRGSLRGDLDDEAAGFREALLHAGVGLLWRRCLVGATELPLEPWAAGSGEPGRRSSLEQWGQGRTKVEKRRLSDSGYKLPFCVPGGRCP